MIEASGGDVGAGLLVLFLVAFAAYMLPTVIGAARKVVNIGSVFAVNLLLGWTLIGWAVALAMALRTNPPHAYGQYWQPGAPPPPAMPPPVVAPPVAPPQLAAGWYVDPSGSTRWWDGAQWTPHTR